MKNTKKIKRISLEVSKDDPDVAYLYLPAYSKTGILRKQVRLLELIPNYKGPDIYLDFTEGEILVGIEILG